METPKIHEKPLSFGGLLFRPPFEGLASQRSGRRRPSCFGPWFGRLIEDSVDAMGLWGCSLCSNHATIMVVVWDSSDKPEYGCLIHVSTSIRIPDLFQIRMDSGSICTEASNDFGSVPKRHTKNRVFDWLPLQHQEFCTKFLWVPWLPWSHIFGHQDTKDNREGPALLGRVRAC